MLDSHTAETAYSTKGNVVRPHYYGKTYTDVLTDFDVSGVGGTVDMGRFQQALDEGGHIYLSGKRYRVTSNLFLRSHTYLEGNGDTVLEFGAEVSLLWANGSMANATVLASDANIHQSVLNFATAGYAVNDLILVYSEEPWLGSVNGGVKGEVVRIKSIDSGAQATIHGALADTYQNEFNAGVRKITPVVDVDIVGLRFTHPNPNTFLTPKNAITATYCVDFNVAWCDFEFLDGPAMHLDTVIGFDIDHVNFDRLANDPANQRFGYGVNVNNACQDGRVSHASAVGGRHLFTTNGNAQGGQPRNIVVANSVGRAGTGEAFFDTHPEGEHISFIGCKVYQNIGHAFKSRSPYTTFDSCEVLGSNGIGFYIQEEGIPLQGKPHHNTIRGCAVRDLSITSGSQGRGIVVRGDDCWIEGFRALRTDQESIYIEQGYNRCTVLGAELDTPGVSANSVGIQVVGQSSGHNFEHVTVRNATSGIRAGNTGGAVTDISHADNRFLNVMNWLTGPSAAGFNPTNLRGTGSPEGVQIATPGSTFNRSDGGAGTSFYVKETGVGSTGWVAK